jgi:hypothetical protein
MKQTGLQQRRLQWITAYAITTGYNKAITLNETVSENKAKNKQGLTREFKRRVGGKLLVF